MLLLLALGDGAVIVVDRPWSALYFAGFHPALAHANLINSPSSAGAALTGEALGKRLQAAPR
jgi:hypothetical protein